MNERCDERHAFLEIRNFGAINHLNIDADKNINLMIGPQASGKSTVGKVLFFCNNTQSIYFVFG